MEIVSNSPRKPIVSYFQRLPIPGVTFSLEFIFKDLRRRLSERIDAREHFAKCTSQGVLQRLLIAAEAARNQGDINHICGDIHFAATFLKREKTVLTILDTGTVERLRGFKKRLYELVWYSIPIRRARCITTISEFSKGQIQKYVGQSRDIHVIPVSVSEKFSYQPKAFNQTLPRILIVRNTASKNVDRMIEAIAGIPCQLVVVGQLSNNQISRLRVLKISFENLVDLPLEALIEEYVRCDLLAFCSTYEGFGMPILEANIVGRAVVTSNVASMPEVAGNAACLVDPLSIEDIRRGFLRVIQDQEYREELIANGRTNALRFRPEAFAQKYWDIYEEVLNANSKASMVTRLLEPIS